MAQCPPLNTPLVAPRLPYVKKNNTRGIDNANAALNSFVILASVTLF